MPPAFMLIGPLDREHVPEPCQDETEKAAHDESCAEHRKTPHRETPRDPRGHKHNRKDEAAVHPAHCDLSAANAKKGYPDPQRPVRPVHDVLHNVLHCVRESAPDPTASRYSSHWHGSRFKSSRISVQEPEPTV